MENEIKFAILATDLTIFTIENGELKVLLIKAKSGSFKGMLALPGGLIKPEEKIDAASKRILKGVVKVEDVYFEQIYTFGDPKRDPVGRVVSVAYLALVPWNKTRLGIKGGAIWALVKHLPILAYDHNLIVNEAVRRLRGKLTYTNIVYGLMPEEFTLTELQTVYESILGKKLDKRNFRKKIESLKLLRKSKKIRRGEATRPARLYCFKEKALQHVEIL